MRSGVRRLLAIAVVLALVLALPAPAAAGGTWAAAATVAAEQAGFTLIAVGAALAVAASVFLVASRPRR